jgi:hypothetical protein
VNHLVISKDGVTFAVNSDPRSVAFDQAFAKSKTAAELVAHGDFTQVKSLDDLFTEEEAAPEFVFEAPKVPRISGPLEKRAALRLIKGGKP